MKILDTVGIDVSKKTIDVVVHQSQAYSQFENSKKGFSKMLKWVYKNTKVDENNLLFVFEHTGLYSYNLSIFLDEKGIKFSMIPGLEIKRSLGITRGKDDKVDAQKIARYAYRLRDEIKPTKLPGKDIEKLKRLLALRDRLVKQRAGYKTTVNEQKRVLLKKDNGVLISTQEKMIKYLTKQIAAIEKEINEIIESNETLKKQFTLITSITSVGAQTALFMIVYTQAFTKFTKYRKFASYSGIAPFTKLSGTSIRGRTKVSNLANKKIKSLLDQCAKNAVIHNPEMKEYYNRRVEEGKNKMSTINIIRNKLLSRIFAVVKRETPYVNINKYAS
jgi:transposase